MNDTHRTAYRLIIAGMLLLSFAVGNMFFNFGDVLADSIQYNRIQADGDSSARAYSTYTPAVPTSVVAAAVVQPTAVEPRPVEVKAVKELPLVEAYVPDRIVISAINLDAPIVPTESKSVELKDQWFDQWLVPDEFAAGWISDSAPLGVTGNTVLSGHHNEYGKVFGHLVELEVGDKITLYSGNRTFEYVITDRMILKEKDVSLSIRQENARWIAPSPDERITLVTCWPKRNNTHRLILVAEPVVSDATFPGKARDW